MSSASAAGDALIAPGITRRLITQFGVVLAYETGLVTLGVLSPD